MNFSLIWTPSIAKGRDLSASGKQKGRTPSLLKIQIMNREWLSQLPMKQKYPEIHHSFGFEPNGLSFIGKWLSHSGFKIRILSKKGAHPFCLSDSLKSFPLGILLLFKRKWDNSFSYLVWIV